MLIGNRRDKQFSRLKSNRLEGEVVGEISCRGSRRRNPREGGRWDSFAWKRKQEREGEAWKNEKQGGQGWKCLLRRDWGLPEVQKKKKVWQRFVHFNLTKSWKREVTTWRRDDWPLVKAALLSEIRIFYEESNCLTRIPFKLLESLCWNDLCLK